MRKFNVWKLPAMSINGKVITNKYIEAARPGLDTLIAPYIQDPGAVFNKTAQANALSLYNVLKGILEANGQRSGQFVIGLLYPATPEEEQGDISGFTSLDFEITVNDAIQVCEWAMAATPIINEYEARMTEFTRNCLPVGKCNLPARPAKIGKVAAPVSVKSYKLDL